MEKESDLIIDVTQGSDGVYRESGRSAPRPLPKARKQPPTPMPTPTPFHMPSPPLHAFLQGMQFSRKILHDFFPDW